MRVAATSDERAPIGRARDRLFILLSLVEPPAVLTTERQSTFVINDFSNRKISSGTAALAEAAYSVFLAAAALV